eukprot:scaffold132018_cov24-Tisochrysis_lutea.AAC.1
MPAAAPQRRPQRRSAVCWREVMFRRHSTKTLPTRLRTLGPLHYHLLGVLQEAIRGVGLRKSDNNHFIFYMNTLGRERQSLPPHSPSPFF